MTTYRLRELPSGQYDKLVRRGVVSSPDVLSAVENICLDVRQRGDEALRRLTEQFDGVVIDAVRVSQAEIQRAVEETPTNVLNALTTAAENIETFHKAQLQPPEHVETRPGVICWRERRPIARVGLYVPAGSAPLPSTVLMLGIPARLAGCSRIVLCSPPQKNGTVDPLVLAAASLVGIHEIYRVGGAQAIAAMAFGTETIPKVDKIFGPGNRYVATAKQFVSSRIDGAAIDLVAGPSELLIVADQSADATVVAADLLSQAEHDPDAQVILITPCASLAERVNTIIDALKQSLPRRAILERSLANSCLLITETLEEAIDFANAYAPEHLMLNVRDAETLVPLIQHAGSVFLGPYAPVTAGDYASGTNHTLPTGGTARWLSGITVESFQKVLFVQNISPEGLRSLAPTLTTLAAAEGLEAHQRAVTVRAAVDTAEGSVHTPAQQQSSGERKLQARHRRGGVDDLVRNTIRNLEPYRSARHDFESGMLFDANENAFGSVLSPDGLALNRYPDPLQKVLRSRLAELAGVRMENVFVGVGSDEAIDLLIRIFCEPRQDSIVIAAPTYGMYRVAATIQGVQVKTCLLRPDFQLDLDALRSTIDARTKMIFCCSPNNPTANLLNRKDLLELCTSTQTILVVDEAYIDFAETESLAALVNELPNLVVLRTLSKAWGLAGIRLGYALAHPTIVSYLLSVKPPYNINALTSSVALQALQQRSKMTTMVQAIIGERQRLLRELPAIRCIEQVFPSQANFVLVRCRDAKHLYRNLAQRGIIVRDRSSEPMLENCLRLTVGTPEQNDLLLNTLEELSP